MTDVAEHFFLARGRKLEIIYDSDAQNPREEWDAWLSTIYHWHDRYNIGERVRRPYNEEEMQQTIAEHVRDHLIGDNRYGKIDACIEEAYRADYVGNAAAFSRAIKKAYKIVEDVAFVSPLYMYDHSGITISTSPFSCMWDSGQVGFIVMMKKDVIKDTSIFKGRWTKRAIADAYKVIEQEVKTFDQYLTGEVYGFRILDKEGEVEDSCWGFYGDDIRENGILSHMSDADVRYLYRTKQITRKRKARK